MKRRLVYLLLTCSFIWITLSPGVISDINGTPPPITTLTHGNGIEGY